MGKTEGITMVHLRACVLGLIVLTSCGPSTTNPSDAAIEQARSAVLAKLASAKLGKLSFMEKTNAVCGSVDASSSGKMEPFFYDVGTTQLSIYDPSENSNGKAYDAAQFRQHGCSIGQDEGEALNPPKRATAS